MTSHTQTPDWLSRLDNPLNRPTVYEGGQESPPSDDKASAPVRGTAGKCSKFTCEKVARAILGQPAKQAGAELYYHAPWREDQNPSLLINTKKDVWADFPAGLSGNAWELAARFAGCDPSDKAAVKAWLKEHDLLNGAKPKAKANGRGPCVAIYLYTDAQGIPVARKRRYEPGTNGRKKDFSWERFKNGKWVSGLGNLKTPLYRFAEIKASSWAMSTEGEKDADAGAKIGFPTCTSGGVNSCRGDHAEALRGKDVVIIPDADEAGRKDAQHKAVLLHGKARSVKICEIPGCKDLAEAIEKGMTQEALLTLFRETPELTVVDIERWDQVPADVPGVLASEVVPQKVQWLWENHVPLGKTTLFDGDPDLAKSTVTIDLVARITRGWRMPDGTECGCPAAGAVIVSLEDGIADTIRPRLEAAGADLGRVRIISTIKGADGFERTPTLPVDLPAIESAIRSVGAKPVILDPLVAMLGEKTNSYRDQDIRRTLVPVTALAERTGAAIIAIRHLTKGGGQNPKYRGGGSIGIIGAARASFLFGEKPGEQGRYVFAPVKGNLWRGKPTSLEYSIQDKDGQPVICWHGACNHNAASLLAQPEGAEESNALTDARNFLEEFLQDGPRGADEVFSEAKRAKVSEKTLYRAKASLDVQSKKEGFGDGQHWVWALPKMVNGPAKMANNESLTTFEQVIETNPFNLNTSTKMAKPENMTIFDGEVDHLRDKPEAEEGAENAAKVEVEWEA